MEILHVVLLPEPLVEVTRVEVLDQWGGLVMVVNSPAEAPSTMKQFYAAVRRGAQQPFIVLETVAGDEASSTSPLRETQVRLKRGD